MTINKIIKMFTFLGGVLLINWEFLVFKINNHEEKLGQKEIMDNQKEIISKLENQKEIMDNQKDILSKLDLMENPEVLNNQTYDNILNIACAALLIVGIYLFFIVIM